MLLHRCLIMQQATIWNAWLVKSVSQVGIMGHEKNAGTQFDYAITCKDRLVRDSQQP